MKWLEITPIRTGIAPRKGKATDSELRAINLQQWMFGTVSPSKPTPPTIPLKRTFSEQELERQASVAALVKQLIPKMEECKVSLEETIDMLAASWLKKHPTK